MPQDSAEIVFQFEERVIYISSPSESDYIGRFIKSRQTFYELDVLQRLRHYLGDAQGIAIDAGAFIGNHTIFFSKFCKVDGVFSFEPSDSSFRFLKHNIKRNNLANVTVFHYGLGEVDGWGKVVIQQQGNLAANSLQVAPGPETTTVPITSIDKVVCSRNETLPISLIKIDVEGWEIVVLRGALRTIQQYRPLLCIEIHSAKNMLRVLQILRKSRYLIRECNGFSPTYIIRWEDRKYWILIKLLNLGWLFLSWFPNLRQRMKDRYGKIIEAIDRFDLTASLKFK